MKFHANLMAFAAVIGLSGTAAFAQDETTNRVAAETDWSVFIEESPKECFAVSKPTATVNTRGGQPVEVRRGRILLFVFDRPGEGVDGQVAFTGGYPFAGGSTVSMQIGGTTYELFTDSEWAWATSPQDDANIVTAMKRGSEAVLTARSSRGTTTRDTFSLLGFTAAVDEANRRCD